MRSLFIGIYRRFVRIFAFISKELTDVLRQTPLILTLVLGPFLILLLFGLGYKNQARPLRTVVVMQQNDPMAQQFVQQVANFSLNIIYEGTTTDENAALQQLKNGNLDLVVVIPNDAMQSIKNNKQAVVQFFHNEIDPYQVSYIGYISNAYTDEVNKMIVRSYAAQGQQSAGTLEQKTADAHQRIQAMRSALQAGDAATAQSEQQQLSADLDAITLLVGGSAAMLGNSSGQAAGTSSQDQAILESLTKLHESNQQMGTIQQNKSSYSDEIKRLDQMDSDLTTLDNQLKDFQSIAPNVLVAPFRGETQGIQNIELKPADFYAPAVVVLLLQHLAVTFSALAIVREQRSGTVELFRISPLSAFETLLGKYLSYLLFGAIVGTIITATLILVLRMPMYGTWQAYVLVMMTLLFTALGVGFLISLLAKTEMQAMQYAMFILLGSVFFSGFFLDLRYLAIPVRYVSWLLPATYAISLLQGIMLRGIAINLLMYIALAGIGLLLFIFAWIMLRRRLQKEWS